MVDRANTEWMGDNEIEAMSSIYNALKSLNTDEQQRILSWVADRLGLRTLATASGRATKSAMDNAPTLEEFEDISSLYDAANPRTDPQRALVAAYWFQVVEKQPTLDSQTLNSALKNLGHGASNITDALTSLMRRKPALVLQTQKMGRTKQARKKYKLTTAGLRTVEAMTKGSFEEE